MGEPTGMMYMYFALPSVPYDADRRGVSLPLDPEVMISVAKAFRDLADHIWNTASQMIREGKA